MCAVLGLLLACGAPFFGLDFGVRCGVLGLLLGRGALSWARFWCAVAVLGSIMVYGAAFCGSLSVRGVWF